MIVSEIILNKKGKPIHQRVKIKCDDCKKEWESYLCSQIKGIKNYERDLCRGCKQREQIKQGLRKQQYINAGEGYRKKYKGKSIEEICGEKKGKEIRQKISISLKGENNPMYGKSYHTHGIRKWSSYQKGKTLEEMFGREKANLIKIKISKASSGKNNPMYGKPSPQGSGNGWSGWYKGWFFRSLKELSFMINVVERFGFEWESGEKKKYKISYINYENIKRNYFSDFILNNKYMVEIKPKRLHNTDTNRRKKEAAIKFCKKNNLKYKLLSPIKTLSFEDIKTLIKEEKLEFIDRYKEKFKLWKKEN